MENLGNRSLILHCDSPIVNSLFSVASEEGPDHFSNVAWKIVPPFISNMPDYQVVGSCNSMLCLHDAFFFDPIYVYDTINGNYFELPKSNQLKSGPRQKLALGFGGNPANMEYKIVRVVYFPVPGVGSYDDSEVQIFTIGTEAWRSLGAILWTLDSCSEALLNGALHWVTKRHIFPPGPCLHIISFNLAEEAFKEIELPTCKNFNIDNFHLVALRGCLSAVMSNKDGELEIWVKRFYNVMNSWRKEYVIRVNVPAGLKRRLAQVLRNWKAATLRLSKGAIQVLQMMNNGEILLCYEEGGLFLYSPQNGGFRKLVVSGLPKWFSTITLDEVTLFPVNAAPRIETSYEGRL
ncbi:hypothetical protein L6164_022172 [Bauhinia variegata]|uniref:Uncharacterized protein n=1 Tax=Bauhinia variegata TaxID=167791 RepID=A0ACB9MFQ8_BAUVA|nr:hypothetical protein L6164_022172 [Bauhinia variegata]